MPWGYKAAHRSSSLFLTTHISFLSKDQRSFYLSLLYPFFSLCIQHFHCLGAVRIHSTHPHRNTCCLSFSEMKLCVSFSALLATLLFAVAQVESFPVKRSPRLATLPLKRLPQRRDVHPSIVSFAADAFLNTRCGIDPGFPQLLQQHINRSHRRHARMNGLEGPSSAELAKRLQKRLDAVEFQKYDKRFNRVGVDKASSFSDESPSVNGENTLVSHKAQHGNGAAGGNPNL